MLAIIIPYVGEWANIVFTCRSVYEELRDFDVEICLSDKKEKE